MVWGPGFEDWGSGFRAGVLGVGGLGLGVTRDRSLAIAPGHACSRYHLVRLSVISYEDLASAIY